ncbi:uncharacterized protein NEMAJ01_0599 [Nematocida major]|uniref:uncharacterized protein n=1 Tax=Nematocida major TaxID=1912982 RepID=UPI0020082028|nr:uncharacterized protein NEMAJ01_0599 [Nematocida major]KAH9385703.1 hypothetical protein NEMAJ01_0599 [Nematocida major]
MLKSQWIANKLAYLLETSLKDMPVHDNNAVLGMLVAFFFGVVSPHVCNRFFIREVFNVLIGGVVLSALYGTRELILVLSGVPMNLLLAYIPIKNKQTRTKVFLACNLVHVFATHMLQGAPEGNPFLILTVSSFFMKYMYIGMEYLPGSSGLMAYFGYVFFLPGLRYGPVISYSTYEKWLSTGYMYLAETADQAEVQKFIGKEKDPKVVCDRKEDYVMHVYSRLIMNSVISFIYSAFFVITHRVIGKEIEAAGRKLAGAWLFENTIAGLHLGKILYISALWVSEEGVYQIGFIDRVENTRLRSFLNPWNPQELFELWNIEGAKLVRRLCEALARKDKKEEETPQKEAKPQRDSSVWEGAVQHMLASVASYGHIFVFPLHAGSWPVAVAALAAMGLCRKTPHRRRESTCWAFIINTAVHLQQLLAFSYFALPVVYRPARVLQMWRSSLAYGHFLCIPGIIEKVQGAVKVEPSPGQQKE